MVTKGRHNFPSPLDEENFNHIISACVSIGLAMNTGRGVNISCDRCFFIAFDNKFIKGCFIKNFY